MDKELIIPILILLIWIILLVISLLLIKYTSFSPLITLIIFLIIIPIFIYEKKYISNFKGKKSFINKEITFTIINNELYVENIKLEVIKRKNKIYIENIDKYINSGIYIKEENILGFIEEPYIDEFIKFLNDNNIKIN